MDQMQINISLSDGWIPLEQPNWTDISFLSVPVTEAALDESMPPQNLKLIIAWH